MKYFNHLSRSTLDAAFLHPPCTFLKTADAGLLCTAVGGLLYTPGSSPDIARTILDGRILGLTSLALCLEDAVGDGTRAVAEENVFHQLEELHHALDSGVLPPDALPLLFVRVKNADMLRRLSERFAALSRVLTGVILPKVTAATLDEALSLADAVAANAAEPFYAMPILESEELMRAPDRLSLLWNMRTIIDAHPGRVLNVRVGATDLCGLYGIRRDMDTSIWSIPVVAGCIADVVRVFALDDAYTVSGPVCEYYRRPNETDSRGLDGLWRETRLDLQNGILGKTCIHPSQLPVVQSAWVVPHAAYLDAASITAGDANAVGVLGGAGYSRMNELKPHALWACKLLRQAQVYGVLRDECSLRLLLDTAHKTGVHQ